MIHPDMNIFKQLKDILLNFVFFFQCCLSYCIHNGNIWGEVQVRRALHV